MNPGALYAVNWHCNENTQQSSMAPILDTLAESEPLFTGDRRADHSL